MTGHGNLVAMARILVDAGATHASAVRAAAALQHGATIEDAHAEIVHADRFEDFDAAKLISLAAGQHVLAGADA